MKPLQSLSKPNPDTATLLVRNHALLAMDKKPLFLYIGQPREDNPIVTPWIEKTSLMKIFIPDTKRYKKE